MNQASTYGDVIEFAIGYPKTKDPSSAHHGSTHEITCHRNGSDVLWVTGQKYDTLVKLATDGRTSLYSMPPGSGPHGIAFDAPGRRSLTPQVSGETGQLRDKGNTVEQSNSCWTMYS